MLDLGVGWVGSPVDVATFLLLVGLFIYEVKPRVNTLSAAVVALADRRDDLDADRLADELDVDEEEVAALRPKIVYRDRDHPAAEEDGAD